MIPYEVRIENVREYVQVTFAGAEDEQPVVLDANRLDKLIIGLQKARERMPDRVAERTYCRPGESVADLFKRLDQSNG